MYGKRRVSCRDKKYVYYNTLTKKEVRTDFICSEPELKYIGKESTHRIIEIDIDASILCGCADEREIIKSVTQ
jgi:hypothetical protein